MGNTKKWEIDRRAVAKKRTMIQEYKKVPCADCGETYPPYVMDFDHREGEEKLFLVSKVQHHGKQKILDEIAKCDVVCSNCHRERTHQRKQANVMGI